MLQKSLLGLLIVNFITPTGNKILLHL